MRKVMELLEKIGRISNLKVIISGAPVSQKYTDDIRADAYASNAPQGVEIVKGWLPG